MSNRLINENSPYLIQHSNNPVEWFPWGVEALSKARAEDKPIFLSIGYAACHWCHVMAHETFEDPDVANLMNLHFINIKVDREERPDLDSIYMSAVVAMTGQGGWPMSVFMTPNGEPFFGGTYFPPVRRYNMPSFREILLTIAKLWQEDRGKLLESGKDITKHLQSVQRLKETNQPIDPAGLDQAAFRLAQSYDWEHGGWGKAPKFPQPMALEFLLRRASRGDSLAKDIVLHALDAMSRGGMYDVVGGGFSRYSTDNNWLIPHFEKMLYDNALLARVYLQGFLISGDPNYRRVCEETLDFMCREMLDTQGGLFSSLDADSEGEEGKFYLWDINEIRAALASQSYSTEIENPLDFFITAYGVKETGNFDGKTVLQRSKTDDELMAQYNLTGEQIISLFDEMNAALLSERNQRVRPDTDDKILVAWNALGLIAFAEAARYLHRDDYLTIAKTIASFLLDNLFVGDRLMRSWRKGRALHNAYVEDYAALIIGLIALYESDPEARWYGAAIKLTVDMIEHFSDPEGGFFDTRDDHDELLLRPKDLQDNATPSGNSLAAYALFELATYSGNTEWWDLAEKMLTKIQAAAHQYPTAFSEWLIALDFSAHPIREIAILGDRQNPLTQELIETVWSRYRPDAVVAISGYPPPNEAPPLLKGRQLVNNLPTAFVCQRFVCQRPVNSAQEMLTLID
jgi:uncharacterized protein